MKRLEPNTVGTHGLALGRPNHSTDSNSPHTSGGKYKRLFPDLPAFDCNEEFLFKLGGPKDFATGPYYLLETKITLRDSRLAILWSVPCP